MRNSRTGLTSRFSGPIEPLGRVAPHRIRYVARSAGGSQLPTVVLIAQIVIALGIFNVWIVRYGKATSWRGSEATNMREEFEVYGLSSTVLRIVGFLKLLFAVLLIAGIWFPQLTKPAAAGLGLLMLGAVFMHFKVKDPPKKSLPAFTMLVLCSLVVLS